MKWVKMYQRKARKARLRILFWILASILFAVFAGICGLDIVAPAIALSFFMFVVGLAFAIAGYHVSWRKYNDNYIILYSGIIKSQLIINGEIECTGGINQHDFYGQLPDGTEVYARVSPLTGSVNFILGATNNHNINFL